jgi:plasmid stabilization system protein ParE
LIEYSRRAERQLAVLLLHYDKLGRTEAVANLLAAMKQAQTRIGRAPGSGLQAPRPYPELATLNYAWIKSGLYWVAYSRSNPPVIAAVFHDSADIPNRL